MPKSCSSAPLSQDLGLSTSEVQTLGTQVELSTFCVGFQGNFTFDMVVVFPSMSFLMFFFPQTNSGTIKWSMSDSLDDPSGLRQSIQNTGLGKMFFFWYFSVYYICIYTYIYIYIAIYWDEQLMMLTIVENFSKPGPYSTTIVHSTVPLSSTISSYCNVLRSTVYHIISHHIISYHIISHHTYKCYIYIYTHHIVL